MKKKLNIIFGTIIFLFIVGVMFGKEVNASTYYNAEIYYDDNYDGTVTVVAAGKYIENANIPSKIEGKTVTKIDDFSGCTKLKSVSIPSTVKEIQYSAFSNCTSLTSIVIPNSVTKMEESVFSNCTSLNNVILPTGLKEIPDGTFYNCKALKNISIPSKIETIGYDAFEQCTALTTITIPSSVKTIGSSAFHGCTALTTITIPSNVTLMEGGSWNYGTFEDCTSLKTTYISAKAEYIPDSMFKNCVNLTTVNFSDSFKNAEDSIFYNCKALKNVKLSKQLTKISYGMFEKCTSLMGIELPDSIEQIDGSAFYNCSSLTTIQIPGRSVYCGSWNNGTFEGCTSLKTVYFTKKIQEISEYAFYKIPANQITIYGYSGTAAKSCAEYNGFKYVQIIPITGMKLTGKNNVAITNSIRLTPIITPTNATNQNVNWSSNNPKIATVDTQGVVKGISAGNVVITATSKDGTGIKASLGITVEPFKDTKPEDWYYTDVKYCYNKGIITGTDKNTFDPNAKFTKGMLVTILWRMEGKPKAKYITNFVDCPKGYWCYDAAQWAISYGIAYKLDATHFNPNKVLERNQFIECLRNYARIKGKDTSARADLTKFKDYNKQPEYSKAAMSWAVAKKIMLGGNNGTMLYPLNTTTKAEAIAFIARYCKIMGL